MVTVYVSDHDDDSLVIYVWKKPNHLHSMYFEEEFHRAKSGLAILQHALVVIQVYDSFHSWLIVSEWC